MQYLNPFLESVYPGAILCSWTIVFMCLCFHLVLVCTVVSLQSSYMSVSASAPYKSKAVSSECVHMPRLVCAGLHIYFFWQQTRQIKKSEKLHTE